MHIHVWKPSDCLSVTFRSILHSSQLVLFLGNSTFPDNDFGIVGTGNHKLVVHCESGVSDGGCLAFALRVIELVELHDSYQKAPRCTKGLQRAPKLSLSGLPVRQPCRYPICRLYRPCYLAHQFSQSKQQATALVGTHRATSSSTGRNTQSNKQQHW